MIYILENVLNSLAGVLKEKWDYPVYGSPNQQGTDFPCFFIFFMPSKVEGHVGNRFLSDLGVDIIFVQQRNITDANKEILEVAGYLDEKLELFLYSDGSGKTGWVRTYERQWQCEDDELHYQFHVRQRISSPAAGSTMKKLEESHAGIKEN